MKKVIVKLRGGLGNQLFQYFSGLELANEYNASLIIDSRALPGTQTTNRQGISLFPQEISSFDHQGLILKSSTRRSRIAKIENYIRSRFDFLDRIIGDFAGVLWLSLGRISGDKPVARKSLSILCRTLIINNPMFNHEDFGYLDKSCLKQLLTIRNPSNWYLDRLGEVTTSATIAVHVRLGDHNTLGHHINLEYISSAIRHSKEQYPNSNIWVFSDDPSLAKDILGSLHTNFRFMAQPPTSRPIETLVLMAHAKCLIMSNSSYSWWAANLGISLGNSAIMSEEWLAPDRVSRFMKFGNEIFGKI